MTEALRALDEALAENDASRVAAALRHLVNAGGGVETLARNSDLKTPFPHREPDGLRKTGAERGAWFDKNSFKR